MMLEGASGGGRLGAGALDGLRCCAEAALRAVRRVTVVMCCGAWKGGEKQRRLDGRERGRESESD